MLEPIIIKVAGDIVSSFFKKRLDAKPSSSLEIGGTIATHLREALTWSRRMQFFGMSTAVETETSTIPLRLNIEPRRFRNASRQMERSETDLLLDEHNYLLLGDPGAGKTTTIKRLVQRLLLYQPTSDLDQYMFPIIVRLREISAKETIVEAAASAIGIPFSRQRSLVDGEDEVLLVGSHRLQDVLIEFLNSNKVVLFLDGLDEVPGERNRLHGELSRLALNTYGSKIILSCRSGDYGRVIDGFDVLEICSLDSAETAAIATAWLGDPTAFINELRSLPYRDLTDRPLLLTQLLYIYQRYGYLPEQPSQVYRRVVSLLLQEWDAERGVVRRSSYAHFDPDRKVSFLAAIAYYLTYKVKTNQFTSRNLKDAYFKICDRFQLPREQASQVIQQIETHTGIIVAASNEMFEFTHLSLQEFLCAEYLSREPHAEHLKDYIEVYPAPVAIMMALSSNASSSFAVLFLRSGPINYSAAGSFLSRLLLERPFFEVSVPLGLAILKLYGEAGRMLSIDEHLQQLIALPNVLESVARALDYYGASRTYGLLSADTIRLSRRNVRSDPLSSDERQDRKQRGDSVPFTLPRLVCVPRRLLTQLSDAGNTRSREILVQVDAAG